MKPGFLSNLLLSSKPPGPPHHGLIKADIRADTNRDGIIDLSGQSDASDKVVWTEDRGAIFLPNIGDTDRRCSKFTSMYLDTCRLSQNCNETYIDLLFDKCNDAQGTILRSPEHLAHIKTVPIANVPRFVTGSISILDTDEKVRQRVRVFRWEGDDEEEDAYVAAKVDDDDDDDDDYDDDDDDDDDEEDDDDDDDDDEDEEDGEDGEDGDGGGGSWIYTDSDYRFDSESLKRGLLFGIDARDIRRPGIWDGRVTIRFTIRHGNTVISTDDVMLRVAPVLTHHHLQDVETVLAANSRPGQNALERFNEHFERVLKWAQVEEETFFIDSSTEQTSASVQDFVEPGYVSMPTGIGIVSLRIMICSAQAARSDGVKVFTEFRNTGIGAVQHRGDRPDTEPPFIEAINGAGNIETIPPYTHKRESFPAGRIVIGGHGSHVPDLFHLLLAQETQQPILLETDWLQVSQVDQFLQFLPANNSRGWAMQVDDPREGIELLTMIQTLAELYRSEMDVSELEVAIQRWDTVSGACNQTKQACQRVDNTSVAELLADDALIKANLHAADKIERNIVTIKEATGLSEKEIIRVPAFYKFAGKSRDASKLTSFFPGVVNSLVLSGSDVLVAPEPWNSALAEIMEDLYKKIGLDVLYIDDWRSHHVNGREVHSGTNTVRDMSDPWSRTS
ncbi:Protein-arginine deiminase type-4 [Colletotrichum trifolii]|uniref:Protein-arginine deiminase type-4 n=1 Tax=Colletotrichum trifolii TaxID=5466 RepID=A0A4R8RND0_COLTR|nr:Protein-arginine deiminase type-4 [Colletotrichum trifolii]